MRHDGGGEMVRIGFGFVAVVFVAACSGSAATAPAVKAPTVIAWVVKTTAPANPPAIVPSAEPAPIAEVQPPPDEAAVREVEERLRRHFAQYKGAASFAFFEQDFAPHVERHLGLKDIAASELVRTAKAFYASKADVSLVPKAGSITLTNDGERRIASFVLTMRWSVKPPAAAAACGYLDNSMTWRPNSRIHRQVDVTTRIVFNGDARIVSYEELSVAAPRLRVENRGDDLEAFASLPTGPARFIDANPTAARVPNGTIVEDLGESFTCGLNQTEVDTVRKVRFNGAPIWLLADWTYDTGHNFVGETLLVPVP